MLERIHASHTTYSWNRYGRFSETQCHWCLTIRQNMPHFTLPTIRYIKASPGTAIIGQDMLVYIPFIADWKKIGEHRQPTDRNTNRKNKSWIDYDNKVVTKYSYGTMVFLRKAESRHLREPWLKTSVNTNGTIRDQCGNKSERINIQRVKPFDDETNI